MINLKDVCYVRLGTPDLETAEAFATQVLGLQVGERGKGALYLRSDDRAHTLCYVEGDPGEQAVGFEVEDEAELSQAATTLEGLGHDVSAGTSAEAAKRKAKAFIAFRDPSGNRIELAVRPERSGKRYFPARDCGVTGFNHVGLNSTDPARDEIFWTQVCNARVSDRIGDIPLMRVNAIRSRATTTSCALFRCHHKRGTRAATCRLRFARHPDHQCGRAACRGFPQIRPRRMDCRARRQHACAHRSHQSDD